MALSEREEYDAAISGKIQRREVSAAPALQQQPFKPRQRPSLINKKWLILNLLFYLIFYAFPLVILPTFVLNTKYDFFLYSQLQVRETNEIIPKYRAELPTDTSIKQSLTFALGPPIGGFLTPYFSWAYKRVVGNMFETVSLSNSSHTFIGLRAGYMVALACINRVSSIYRLSRKYAD